ncbi:MAG TPA: C-type lectin domain-containing protein [Kofleriaceae bacterium]|nr:C-type lectin domain-containing protein [Kofleriaceae bacterium]
MRAWCLVLVSTAGCAQLFGIEQTTSSEVRTDAAVDARRDSGIDARTCSAGDAHVTDPMTGACYMFFVGPKTRDEARATCNTEGALLASVESANENQLITSLLGMNLAFLGGTDEVTEGTFKWEDGTAVVLTNFATGEPNNGTGLFEEDCIVIHGDLAGKWDDRPCGAEAGATVPGAYAFVCERD